MNTHGSQHPYILWVLSLSPNHWEWDGVDRWVSVTH